MLQIWARGLKQFITGTTNGSKHCLDVHVANTISTSMGSYSYKERRFHLGATLNIPARSSSMVQLDANSTVASPDPDDIANTITEMGVNWNGGEAIEIGVGADAATAASNIIGTVGAGQTRSFGVSLSSGNKVWVRALKDAAITDGELTVVFLG